MFCSKCGNQIPDGSSFCNSCGNRVGGTQGGFNGTTPYMTKKEYFQTACSFRARNIIKAEKIVLIVCAVLMLFSTVIAFRGVNEVFDEILVGDDFRTAIAKIEEYSGESLELSEEDYQEFEIIEKELGIGLVEFMKIVMYTILVGMALVTAAIIILSFFTIRNVNLTTAIIALILSALFVRGLVELGLTVTLLVLVCILRKEYKTYCEHPFAFNNANSTNEPDFSK
ncbi:MAG: zinc-ribbon domain-containing protein [Clostridia bacterium]|nr:zinc-ribbon domain-containing protein [Clostridia bacterium]